jgi:diguanylate cyclase (GGDEF)-like protein/PAS domain S-box-containing protein
MKRDSVEQLRILVVDDSPADAELAVRELQRAGLAVEARRVDTEESYRRALDEFRPQLILSDFSMPAFGGLAALDLAREKLPDVPFVFVSGTIGEDRAVEAMKRGATDYVLKDRMNRLVPVIRRALQEAAERAARRRAEQWRDRQNRILELIASGAPLAEALGGLMLAVEAQAPGMLCSILLPDGDGARLRTGAAPSLPEAYNRAVDGVAIGPAAGSCGTAAYRKEQVIVTNIATDPLWADYRELAETHGLRACWSTPILSRPGSLLGTFANYFQEPRGPAAGELELVASATHTARIAIEKRRDEAEILRAKERLDLALEASGAALWDNDVTSGRVYLNEHWARLLDYEPRETVTTVSELAQIAHPDDRQMLLELASDTIRGRRASYDAEHRVMTKGGEWKWILSRGKVVERAADGQALRVVGTNMDITQRKLQEQRIARLSRIHAVLSGINSAIVRIRDRQELLDEACRIAREHGKFTLAWIGMLDEAARAIKPVARAGREEGYLERLDLTMDPITTGDLSMAAEAVASRQPVVCNDIETDGRVRPWRTAALARGYRSAVLLPLLLEQKAVGILALYSPEAGFFDDEEMKLLAELAGDIAFALQTIERQERLDFLSYYDALTGLPNRALFLDRTGQQMRSRGGEPLMVAMILLNIERFRYINESFGHRGGDELLKLVARRLEAAFRGKDYLARIGADGFGVVMRGIRDAAAVVHVVENQLLGCFREPYALNGAELRVVAKAGIAMYPADGGDADTLFKNAEAALKKARDSGERHLFYAADMNARAAHALSLETRLRKALEAQQFVLHFQPKVDLAADSICGLEALLRWNDPETGLVPPNQFIPLLEETGMILEVGRWAIRHALSQRLAWHIKGLKPPRIAVNVSATQLRQADFVRVIRDSLDGTGVGPHGLDFEITESMVMKDIENNIEKLRALREMGINIAIDDFGTGYSSLSYAARLPIDALKVDRSFIHGMTENPHDMAIVTTIIALARSLNLKVVAEGVETAEQSRLLSLVKCDEAQGFLFSKPLPATDIERLLGALAPEARHRGSLNSSTAPAQPFHVNTEPKRPSASQAE